MATASETFPVDLPDPLTLRLPFWLAREFSLKRLLARTVSASWSDCWNLIPAFAHSGPERQFVREVLQKERRLWLFRCHQRAFCGDFVIVDMSPPPGQHRWVSVVELKSSSPLTVGGGGAGNQFKNIIAALQHVKRQIPHGGAFHPHLVSGDGEVVLQWLRRLQSPKHKRPPRKKRAKQVVPHRR